MRVILSRKGFDSSYGGCPSPVLPDGTMLSMPIPSGEDSELKFDDIKYGEYTYSEIWNKLNPKLKNKNDYCHLDPDIRADVRVQAIENWVPAFGQTHAAQNHLKNKDISVGDLFLFFGWFRKTDSNFKYLSDCKDKHMIYGYMQIGDIVKNDDIIQKSPWHPHSKGDYGKNNTLYVASENLTIDGIKTDLPGFGTFNYSEDIVLTKDGCSRSRWKLNPSWNIDDFFKNNFISYHSKNSVKDGYFQSAYRGQEFVISENEKVTKWAYELIKAQFKQNFSCE